MFRIEEEWQKSLPLKWFRIPASRRVPSVIKNPFNQTIRGMIYHNAESKKPKMEILKILKILKILIQTNRVGFALLYPPKMLVSIQSLKNSRTSR